MSTLLDELLSSYGALPPKAKAEFKETVIKATEKLRWIPNPGPQSDAYFSEADELFYGGAAGGGKTDLVCGLALNAHHKSLIVRREGPDLDAMEGRFKEIIGNTDGWNGQDRKWRLGKGHEIKLGSCKNEDDKHGYQGQPHDLKAFDEITQFTESQFRYIIGWNRSTKKGQRCRVVATGNPPMTAEGYWVKKYWAPWLDRAFPNPAKPGELRWATTDPESGETLWVDKDWSRVDPVTGETIRPRSRTFIPALLKDNPFQGPDYLATLANLPEPLRTQLLTGDFHIAERDQVNQVIPTAWIRAAIARWTPEGMTKPMISMGVDVANSVDQTVLAPRHLGDYMGKLIAVPGSQTPDGPTAAAFITTHVRHNASINIDMGGGYGQSAHDHLKENSANVWKFIPAGAATKASKNGLKYYNLRAQGYWELRLLLDPASERKIALPPDEEMVADLCAPTWALTPRGIKIEDKEAIRDRLGRSPDKGDAVVMAFVKPFDDLEAERNLPAHLGRHRRATPPPKPPQSVLDTI
jgi:hypothetical protein